MPAGSLGWKRGLDLAVTLLVLLPALLLSLLLICWIRLVSPGSVVFRQQRIGRHGKPFTLLKFRSMKPDAAAGVHECHIERLVRNNRPMTKLDLLGDERLIPGGRLMRMAGLDELPQLLNVLRGEMSLVGPRPCLPTEMRFHGTDCWRRFSVKPGLTGLWQVRRNRTTTFREMVRIDHEYVDGLSPWQDCRILLWTPVALLRQLAAVRRGDRRRPRKQRRARRDRSVRGAAGHTLTGGAK